MTFEQYIKEAIKTNSEANFLSEDVKARGLNENLLHSILGIQTESNELSKAFINLSEENLTNKEKESIIINILEEIGDICWYMALGFNELGINITVTNDDLDLPDDYDILDKAKRTLYYGEEFDKKLFGTFLKGNILFFQELLNTLNNIDENFNKIIGDKDPFEYVLEKNIEKLKKRYGEKFENEKALNRNIEEELKVFKL